MQDTLFGDDYDKLEAVICAPAEDIPRLTKHLKNFLAYVSDGQEHTLGEIADALGMAQTSASARWRDLTKLGYNYTRRESKTVKGLWFYRLEVED